MFVLVIVYITDPRGQESFVLANSGSLCDHSEYVSIGFLSTYITSLYMLLSFVQLK